jgi:CO dehydrogenase maturation factor
MRIAFVGKGGSGKTTLSALFSRYLAAQKLPVLAIDADINQHLAYALDAKEQRAKSLRPLGQNLEALKNYLRGANPRIASSHVMIKTTPPGRGSRLLRLQERNFISEEFETVINGVRVLAVGAFTEEDLGIKCYHSKLGAIELLLNHLIDGEREYVIVDMTAGADAFASSLFTKFDLTFLLVEPTQQSVSVYRQYRDYARSYGVTLKAVANKISDADDLAFVAEHAGEDLIAALSPSRWVRALEKGRQLAWAELEPENMKALKNIQRVVDAQPKNWQRFYDQTVQLHLKNALHWANASVGADLRLQIDPEFSLEEQVRS